MEMASNNDASEKDSRLSNLLQNDKDENDSFMIEWSDEDPSMGYEPGHYAVAYTCKQLLENNKASPVKVDYYYDLLRSDADDENDILQRAENDLLKSVAFEFGLINGARCSVPPIDVVWLVRISSWPRDQLVQVFDSCQVLENKTMDGQSCNVYKGTMTGYALGDVDERDLVKFIQTNMKDAASDDSYSMEFLGTQLDTSLVSNRGKDRLPPAVNAVEKFVQKRTNRKVSWLGGLLVAGFVVACLGMIVVLYRRRRKWLASQDVEFALSKSNLDEEQDVNPRKLQSIVIQPVPGDDDSMDESSSRASSPDRSRGAYAFDLGTDMKNQMFGIHGKSGRGAVAPNMTPSMDEVASDSDADSWAQTDGTIGSLELQLEPITAEV